LHVVREIKRAENAVNLPLECGAFLWHITNPKRIPPQTHTLTVVGMTNSLVGRLAIKTDETKTILSYALLTVETPIGLPMSNKSSQREWFNKPIHCQRRKDTVLPIESRTGQPNKNVSKTGQQI
jgi:hypothetical protein